MKPIDKCRGCSARRLVNPLGLCKRCNRESHKYISDAEILALKAERAAAAAGVVETPAGEAKPGAEKKEDGKKDEKGAAKGGEKKEEGKKDEKGAAKKEEKKK